MNSDGDLPLWGNEKVVEVGFRNSVVRDIGYFELMCVMCIKNGHNIGYCNACKRIAVVCTS